MEESQFKKDKMFTWCNFFFRNYLFKLWKSNGCMWVNHYLLVLYHYRLDDSWFFGKLLYKCLLLTKISQVFHLFLTLVTFQATEVSSMKWHHSHCVPPWYSKPREANSSDGSLSAPSGVASPLRKFQRWSPREFLKQGRNPGSLPLTALHAELMFSSPQGSTQHKLSPLSHSTSSRNPKSHSICQNPELLALWPK